MGIFLFSRQSEPENIGLILTIFFKYGEKFVVKYEKKKIKLRIILPTIFNSIISSFSFFYNISNYRVRKYFQLEIFQDETFCV